MTAAAPASLPPTSKAWQPVRQARSSSIATSSRSIRRPMATRPAAPSPERSATARSSPISTRAPATSWRAWSICASLGSSSRATASAIATATALSMRATGFRGASTFWSARSETITSSAICPTLRWAASVACASTIRKATMTSSSAVSATTSSMAAAAMTSSTAKVT